MDEKTTEIANISKKVTQKQDLADDLKLSEQRCQSQKLQIAKLEQRIDELMATQRASAEQIAECKHLSHFKTAFNYSECSVAPKHR